MIKKELETRLINFSIAVLQLTDHIIKDHKSVNLIAQVSRSCISAALNYGEAQSAESKKDFIHKVGIVMKELRETQVSLVILCQLKLHSREREFLRLISENDELLAIFHKTIQTARKNL